MKSVTVTRRKFIKIFLYYITPIFYCSPRSTKAKSYSVKVSRFCCIGCEECVSVCPAIVFEMVDAKAFATYADECTGCLSCIDVCEAKAISVEYIEKSISVNNTINDIIYDKLYKDFEKIYKNYTGRIYRDTGILFPEMTPSSTFIHELNLQSFERYELLCTVEKEFGINFTEHEISNINAVHEFVTLLETKLKTIKN